MTDPEGNQETYGYDAGERLCHKRDRNGTETTYKYNIYGNLLERWGKEADGERKELSERYEYTPEGLLKSAISSDGMRYSYSYDSRNRLTEKKASGRTLLSLAYDLNGNLTKQTDVSGKTTEYHYDLIDRITEVWDNGKQVAGYEYNPDNTIKKLYCGSLYTEYAYDTDRNLIGLKTMLGTELLADNHYCYDGNGNRIEKRQIHSTTTYTYDARNRLSSVEYPGRKEGLFYDKAGNRTKRVCNGMEELYRYDSRNRLRAYTKGGVTTEFDYDKAGNLIKDDKATYHYDAFNRTSKVETFDGNIQINRYDAEGLRHEMEENGKLVSFIFRGTEVVAEESQQSRIRYIRTGELLASDAECAKTYYHYASDEMGSITHVVSGGDKDGEETELSAGSILNRYEYDAWGNLTVCEETVENRFKFNGQQYDPITQQYYLRARYYNPVIGRFTQEDTYRNDGLNLYVYCRNNPVYYVDPSGNICETAAERIKDKFGANGQCTASRNEQKKLAAYLRDKARKNGPLDPREAEILNQIDDYTYLPRYENQTMPGHLISNGGPTRGYYTDSNERWHRPNGQFASNAEVGIYRPSTNNNSNSGRGGRLGNESTRAQNRQIADYLESQGFTIIGGGGRGPEEYLPGANGGNKGSNYLDVTAQKGDNIVRINTVDVLGDGITPTLREQMAADSINKKTGGTTILIPKGAGTGELSNIIK